MSIFQKCVLIAIAIVGFQSMILPDQEKHQLVFDFACDIEATGSDHHVLVNWLKHEALSINIYLNSGVYAASIIINSSHLDQKAKISALINLMIELKAQDEKSKKEHEEWQKQQDEKHVKTQEERVKEIRKGALALLIATPIIAFAIPHVLFLIFHLKLLIRSSSL